MNASLATAEPDTVIVGERGSPVAPYLDDVVAELGAPRGPMIGLVLFGSLAVGGHGSGSDVDLLLVLDDAADRVARGHVIERVGALEVVHGIGKPHAGRHPLTRALGAAATRLTSGPRPFFVCSRGDLLSGDPVRILGVSAVQAPFVDRGVIASIVSGGRTVWGESLLDRVPLPALRRLDVAKAGFTLMNAALLAVMLFPVLPDATRLAMDALKRSVHSVHFCHRLQVAALSQEIDFIERHHGPVRALQELLELRSRYRPSLGFVLRCPGTIARLHLRAARTLQFPRPVRPHGQARAILVTTATS